MVTLQPGVPNDEADSQPLHLHTAAAERPLLKSSTQKAPYPFTDAKRRQLILEHIGRYRLSLRPTLSKLFFSGEDPGNVIQALLDEDLIQARTGLSGGYSYYQLTQKAARSLAVPIDRTRPLGSRKLPKHLAILWFCCMSGRKCTRLDRADIRQIFGTLLTGDFCWERNAKGKDFFYSVYVVEGSTDAYWVERLQEAYQLTQQSEVLGKMLDAERFRPVFLVPSKGRKKELEQSFIRARVFPMKANHQPFLFAIVPSPKNLALALNELI